MFNVGGARYFPELDKVPHFSKLVEFKGRKLKGKILT
jgi:hypothetical protein